MDQIKDTSDEVDEYGDDFEYDDEFEAILHAAETQSAVVPPPQFPVPQEPTEVIEPQDELSGQAKLALESMDIEDIAIPSPLESFRRHGYLSVSDLVGTVWCEVQYDYRLRTLPYLKPADRPDRIVSNKGKEIVVDRVKTEGRERIVQRGQVIHKRLEREIHPNEVVVATDTREEVWGLKLINMLAALEALITLGTCRELPVVGFVGGILVTGIIDELQRHPIDKKAEAPRTRSSRQTALTSFFSPSKPRPPRDERIRTHKIYVSDSKTRARDCLPKEADTMAGQLQCMMYKELLDAMLLPAVVQDDMEVDSTPHLRPSSTPLAFATVFEHLGIHSSQPFSDRFIAQIRPIILGNALRMDANTIGSLDDLVQVWKRYIPELGLGTPLPILTDQVVAEGGRTETRLELVYRRAGPKKVGKRDRSRKGKGEEDHKMEDRETLQPISLSAEARAEEEDRPVQLAIDESLKLIIPELPKSQVGTESADRSSSRGGEYQVDRTSDEEREEDELALAVEMSLAGVEVDDTPGEVTVPLSQSGSDITPAVVPEQRKSHSPSPPPGTGTASGSIIGRHRFQHDTALLENHLKSVLQYWLGEREPVGVAAVDTNRCGWCEFEEGCEWRSMKAEEDWKRSKSAKAKTG